MSHSKASEFYWNLAFFSLLLTVPFPFAGFHFDKICMHNVFFLVFAFTRITGTAAPSPARRPFIVCLLFTQSIEHGMNDDAFLNAAAFHVRIPFFAVFLSFSSIMYIVHLNSSMQNICSLFSHLISWLKSKLYLNSSEDVCVCACWCLCSMQRSAEQHLNLN